jgi:hypothetical protein
MPQDDLITTIVSQLTDPFRIGLIAALIYTTIRNAAITGWLVPMAAGIVFVAFIIAVTMPSGGQSQAVVISAGVISNAVIAAIMFGALFIWRRFSK